VGNTDVSFGDIDMSKDRVTSLQGMGGKGGWPTIRYFNAETGINGAEYKKKTSEPICEELKKDENMRAYILEYGKTTLESPDGDEL